MPPSRRNAVVSKVPTTAADRLIDFQWRINDRWVLIEQMVFISFLLTMRRGQSEGYFVLVAS